MKKPLSKAIRYLYGIGDMGFSLMTSVELYLFVFFLTDVAKFPMAWVTAIGTITAAADAIFSPFYGAVIAGTKPMRWGRNRSYMLLFPPLVVATYWMQFSRIGTDMVAAVIICAGFIISHILWNFPWVGNVNLIPTLASDGAERGLLSSRRAAYSAVAGIIYSYLGSNLAIYLGKVTNNEVLGYTLLALIASSCFCLLYWLVFKITDGYEEIPQKSASLGESKAAQDKASGGELAASLFKNPHLLFLLLGDLFRYMSSFVVTAATAYYFKYVAKNSGMMSLYLLLASFSGLLGAMALAPLSKRMANKTILVISLGAMGLCMVGAYFFGFNPLICFIFAVAARLIGGIGNPAAVTLYSEAAIYSEWKTGTNTTAFIMGLMNLSLKVSVISRSIIIPLVLGAVGFVSGIAVEEATAAIQKGILQMWMLIPAIALFVAATILVTGFRLTPEKIKQYQEEIAAKKA